MYRPAPPPIRVVLRPMWGRLAPLLLLALAPLVGTAFALLDVRDELALRTRGRTTGARIVEVRPVNHEVRYRFELPDTPLAYSRAESTGRHDLWSELPERVYRLAVVSGRLAVVYLPDDPWANRPVAVAPGIAPLGDPLAAGVLCALVGLIIALVPLADRARCRRKLASGSPQVNATAFWRGYHEVVPAG